MELRLQRIALILAVSLSAQAQTDQPPGVANPPLGVMRRAILEDAKPYEVAVGAVPTTILMPAPIEAFEGNNITTTPNTAAALFLQHEPGTRFFSVKSLLPGTADLNVIIGNSVYSFRFYYSENPTRTLVIEPLRADAGDHGYRNVRISPRRLYDILQDAKTYFVIKDQHPELVRRIQAAAPGKVMEYLGYRVVIDQIFRFDTDDTLIFRVVFLNDTEATLYYKPEELGLRVGRNIYWPSFAQVPRFIPARAPAHLTWTVSPDVDALEITSPRGLKASIADRPSVSLSESGEYIVTATGKNRRSDSVKFVVAFPPRPRDPDPLVVSKGPESFGIRKLTLSQPEAGQNFGYVCYTGTADGHRADLSIGNDFALIVPARPSP